MLSNLDRFAGNQSAGLQDGRQGGKTSQLGFRRLRGGNKLPLKISKASGVIGCSCKWLRRIPLTPNLFGGPVHAFSIQSCSKGGERERETKRAQERLVSAWHFPSLLKHWGALWDGCQCSAPRWLLSSDQGSTSILVEPSAWTECYVRTLLA